MIIVEDVTAAKVQAARRHGSRDDCNTSLRAVARRTAGAAPGKFGRPAAGEGTALRFALPGTSATPASERRRHLNDNIFFEIDQRRVI